jgi:hypothetical protein
MVFGWIVPPPSEPRKSSEQFQREREAKVRTTRDALYPQIRRGTLPGVVRVGSRRLMVKTDEFLRDLPRMPTLE